MILAQAQVWDFGGRTPMAYLHTFGPRADPGTALAWGMMILSVAVVVVVTLLVLAGVILRGRRASAATIAAPAEVGKPGLMWIYVGLGLTVVALAGTLVWTMGALAAEDSPATRPRLTLDITGRQWWWQVRYLGDTPGTDFVTANEIHIPVGEPVLVKLEGGDVIHSFWVPGLTGKTETIPGRTNIAWMQADRAGAYRGQCAEFCGLQHAHMALYVVAEPPAAFEAWRRAQLRPAPAPAALTAEATAGEGVFVTRCGACHAVRGGAARGTKGPDLTHLMSRATIASGTLPNNPSELSGWIANPQALKPGALMPATYLTGPQLGEVAAYLRTLR